MFDLPVDTSKARRAYTRFRKALLKQGFTMMQYSVYARYFNNEDASIPYKRAVKRLLPDEGQVRLITITDKQFGKMEVFYGKTRSSAEEPPKQLMLFGE